MINQPQKPGHVFDAATGLVQAQQRYLDTVEIQDGHHRTEAAKQAGLDRIPVRVWEGPKQ